MTGKQVVCAGHVNWDVTVSVDRLPDPDGEAAIVDHHEGGGGSASNTAVALAGLGPEPTLVGSVGDDRQGSLVRELLDGAGVDCAPLQVVDGVTTIKYLVVDGAGQVMVFANDGANERFDGGSLPEPTLAGADHLHLTSQRPATAKRLADRANDVGVQVSFDPGRRLDVRGYDRVYRLADVVFLNESEAATLEEPELLEGGSGAVVIKRGGDGAEATRRGRRVSHPGFPADVVDTTGAGDAFAAGFIAARLDGADLEEALAAGNACGALATQSVGAQTRLSWEEIERLRGSA